MIRFLELNVTSEEVTKLPERLVTAKEELLIKL